MIGDVKPYLDDIRDRNTPIPDHRAEDGFLILGDPELHIGSAAGILDGKAKPF